MFTQGQMVRVNLAGMQVSGVLFHAAVTDAVGHIVDRVAEHARLSVCGPGREREPARRVEAGALVKRIGLVDSVVMRPYLGRMKLSALVAVLGLLGACTVQPDLGEQPAKAVQVQPGSFQSQHGLYFKVASTFMQLMGRPQF